MKSEVPTLESCHCSTQTEKEIEINYEENEWTKGPIKVNVLDSEEKLEKSQQRNSMG